MKRQRWLARQRGENVNADGRAQCLQLGDVMPSREQHHPKSPLSQLVAEGYSRASSQPSMGDFRYGGERPSSDPLPGSYGGQPQPRSSSGPRSGGLGGHSAQSGGFDARVAGQWSADVQQGVHQRQSRHDPSVAGPPIARTGQRVTQAPGGGAAIDLSWASTQGQATGAHPPRMPGLPSGPNSGRGTPVHGEGCRQAGRATPSCARGGGSSPWGRDGDGWDVQNAVHVGRREPCPFGVDSALPGAGARSSSRGRRAPSPSPGYNVVAAPPMSKDVAAAGAVRGRAAGRPPGGASSFVFG
eukprot:CAMPEP_0171061452 /NCGR_PEP_ID=MMETSP0766_2-20121228/4446_1 /TAXON_ID=439317 /ORGANISM="Gambierdiscus australes, Strain CAWD 149" /LENGTH=298 /DNA_ID=CAMNT_0011517137 /DNA_START=1 /DNA_END=897 /DNA_ORIENTATION=-